MHPSVWVGSQADSAEEQEQGRERRDTDPVSEGWRESCARGLSALTGMNSGGEIATNRAAASVAVVMFK